MMDEIERSDELTLVQRLVGSRAVTGGGMWLSKTIPPFVGYGLARAAADAVYLLKPAVYGTVYGCAATLLRVKGNRASCLQDGGDDEQVVQLLHTCQDYPGNLTTQHHVLGRDLEAKRRVLVDG